MSPKKKSNTNFIKLYSSTNLSTTIDTETIVGVGSNDKIKFLIKFVSLYGDNYFKAIVVFDLIIKNGVVSKKNVTIRDICFKNELNVSESSQTQDYQYLYDISCSSADNNDSSSCSSSSNLSIQSIINKNVEKQIATNIKGFIDSYAFDIVYASGTITINLDVTKFPGGDYTPTFQTVKNIIKYKFIDGSSSNTCYSSTSSKSSKSSKSSNTCKPNKIFKLLVISSVITFVIILIIKLCKKHNCSIEYKSLLNKMVNKVKSIVYK